MLNELLEMLGGGDEDGQRECCQQRQARPSGIRGLIARLLNGDGDNDDNRGRDSRCCSGVTRDGDDRDSGRAGRRRDRDERADGFDFGD